MLITIRHAGGGLPARHCLAPKSVFDELLLEAGEPHRIRAGQAATEAVVQPQPGAASRPPVVYLGRDCLGELALPGDLTLHLQLEGARRLAVGPVVGVFVNDRYLASLLEQAPPVSARELAKANSLAHTLLYWFSADRARLVAGRVRGVWCSPAGRRWSTRVFPLGDVVYDRGVNFTPEERPVVRYLRRQLREAGRLRLVNTCDAFDKWGTHQALAGCAQVAPYLPATLRYHSIDDALSLLRQWGLVYLKSRWGRGGRQVMAVEARDGQYLCIPGRQENSRVVHTAAELAALLDSFLGGAGAVVQQGIELLQHRGRRMDMRVLVTKNGQGAWEAMSNQVRLGRPGQRVTNARLGAEVVEFTPLMAEVAGSASRARALDEEMRRLSLFAARQLEAEYGPQGEMGMDLALDQEFKVWFLEANAKPDKDPEPFEGVRDVYPQFLNTLEYARFLAGFDPPGRGPGEGE